MATIHSHMHPHPLTESHDIQEFVCDGCRTYGAGKRYRCIPCNFDVHDYCSTCPSTLSSFMHPPHSLALVTQNPPHMHQIERFCDVCRDKIEGQFYSCNICDFDLHPLCTQLPQHVHHVLHPLHALTLQASASGTCKVCFGTCDFWRYNCAICCVDIHVDCVLAQCSTSTTPGVYPAGPPHTELPLNPSHEARGIDPLSHHYKSAPPSGFQPPFHHQQGGFSYGGYPNPNGANPYHGDPHLYGGYPGGCYPNFGGPQQYVGYPGGGFSNLGAPHQYVGYPNPGGPHQSGNNQVHGVAGSSTGRKMYQVVQTLTIGVISSFVFGSPLDFF